jgi:hypothetical protein
VYTISSTTRSVKILMSLQEHLILMCIIAEASNPFQKIHWHILEPQSFGDARRRDPRKELPTDRSALKAFPHCKRWLLLVSRARTSRTTDVSLMCLCEPRYLTKKSTDTDDLALSNSNWRKCLNTIRYCAKSTITTVITHYRSQRQRFD